MVHDMDTRRRRPKNYVHSEQAYATHIKLKKDKIYVSEHDLSIFIEFNAPFYTQHI